MDNLWLEIRKTVQIFSDMFFAAVESWKGYGDVHLIKNRVQLCEAMHELIYEYTISDTDYIFSLFTSNSKPIDMTLLNPEIQPYYGNEFVPKGDLLTFSRIEEKMDKEGFKLAGLFFQNILLYGLAGVDVRTMREANLGNRAALLDAFRLILRLPESLGIAHIRVGPKLKSRSTLKEHKVKEIQSVDGLRLFQYLVSFQAKPSAETEGPKETTQRGGSSSSDGRVQEKKRQREESPAHDSSPSPPSSALRASSSSDSPVQKHRRSTKITPRLQPPTSFARGGMQPTDFGNSSLGFTDARRTARQPSPHLSPVTPTTSLQPKFATPSTTYTCMTDIHSSYYDWTTEHNLIGKRLAAMRALPLSAASGTSKTSSFLYRTPKLQYGSVTAAATHTDPTARHHAATTKTQAVFQVEWDEPRLSVEVLTLSEVLDYAQTYDETEGWTTTHESVGTLVAAVFPRQRPWPKELRGKVVALGNEDLYLGKVRTVFFFLL